MKKINSIFEEAYRNVKNSQINFLCECYSETTFNNAPMIHINETNAKKMMDRHTVNGYIVISPCRGGSDFGLDNSIPDYKEKLAQINNKRIKDMISDIKASGYAYTPTYGGFIENIGTSEEENVYERSFIIYNQLKNRGVGDFKSLYEFGIELSKKYNQDSFLCQAPGEKPKYISQNGDVDIEFSGKVSFNDMAQEYFTDLHKNTHKFKDIEDRKPTRFSFVECYINPSPQCYSERVVRGTNGEIFVG